MFRGSDDHRHAYSGNPGGLVTTIVLCGACIFTVVACSAVILSYVGVKLLRRPHAVFLVCIAALDIVFATTAMASHIQHIHHAVDACQETAALALFAALGSQLYVLGLLADVLRVIRWPFSTYHSFIRAVHAAVLVLAGAAALELGMSELEVPAQQREAPGFAAHAAADNYIQVCFARVHSGSVAGSIAGNMLVAPLVLINVVGTVGMALARRWLGHGLPGTNKQRTSAFRSAAAAVGIYLGYWLVVIATFLLLDSTALHAPRSPWVTVLSACFAAMFAGRGVVTLAVWVRTTEFKQVIELCDAEERQELRSHRLDSDMEHGGGDTDSITSHSPSFSSVAQFGEQLQQPLMPGQDWASSAQASCLMRAMRWCVRAMAVCGCFMLRGAKRDLLVAELGPREDSMTVVDLRPALTVALRREVLAVACQGIRAAALLAFRDGGATIASEFGQVRIEALHAESPRVHQADALLRRALGQLTWLGCCANPVLRPHPRLASLEVAAPLEYLSVSTDNSVRIAAQVQGVLGKAHSTGITVLVQPLISCLEVAAAPAAQGSREPSEPCFSVPASPQLARAWSTSQRHTVVASPLVKAVPSAGINAEQGSAMEQFYLPGNEAPKVGTRLPGTAAAAPRSGSVASFANNDCFVSFSPELFQQVRSVSGVSASEYVAALAGTRREKFSEGASGAFLAFSINDAFILKTLTLDEVNTLLGMLPAYLQHLYDNPDSLLTRFFGCHAVLYGSSVVYFTVMRNVLAAAGHTVRNRYDLKGSWVHRFTKLVAKGQIAHCRYCSQPFRVGAPRSQLRCPARPNRTHAANTVMKDNEFAHRLWLSPEHSERLGNTLTQDVLWLRDQGITDYSLLVGAVYGRYHASAVPLAVSTPTSGVAESISGTQHSVSLAQQIMARERVATAGVSQHLSRRLSIDAHSLAPSDSRAHSPAAAQALPTAFGYGQARLPAAAVEGPTMYLMGLIDVLQGFTWGKRLERALKRFVMCRAGHGISALPAPEYAARFRARVINQLMYNWADEHVNPLRPEFAPYL